MAKPATSIKQDQRNERNLTIAIACILLLFGISHSVMFYGHEQVPNPDFAHFVDVGHKLWSFELPEDWKRAPLLGLLQVPIGWIFGGPYPDLRGGWVLNAFLHPLNLLLIWLVSRRLIGQAGLWLSIVAIINPQVIYLITQPIAETALMFFCLLSFFLMFNRSRWSYLTAAMTTMIRYEGAALILAAFVLDMIYTRDKKERLRCLLFAFFSSLPLALWILGMISHWEHQGGVHYLQWIYLDKLKDAPQVIKSLWNVTFSPLIIHKPGIPLVIYKLVFWLSKILVVITFLVSLAHTVWKRKWYMLALYIFFLPYMFVHIIYFFSVPRFYATVHWMLLIFCFDGFYLIWTGFSKAARIPNIVVRIMQSILGLGALMWFLILARSLSELKVISPPSYYFPHLTLIALGLILTSIFYFEHFLSWRNRLLTIVLLLLAVTANQYKLAPAMGYGNELIEFKHATEWFLQNAKPESRIVSSLADVMQVFARGQTARLIHITSVQADSPELFVKKCREKNIHYVIWDSRIGLNVENFYYKKWGIKNITMLSQSQDIGPYKFVKTFQNPQRKNRYIHLFYLE
jgi:hypothetical protein